MKPSRNCSRADYVVVGCGVAGLRAAIELSDAGSVLVLAKSDLADSATGWARGGIAAALSDEDAVGLHEQETLKEGDGLCRAELVKLLVDEGPQYITQLIGWCAGSCDAGTKLAFTREAAHSRSRILHTHGGSTGFEIGRVLLARAQSIPHLHLRARAFTTVLILESGRVAGVRFIDETDGAEHEVRAGGVLLATGGLGQVYRETTNPDAATGDGMAIAYDAGALLSDLEFIQFYPTALAVKGAPRLLLPEAFRSEGGILRNVQLERFMKRYHEAQELAPRDVLARAISSEMHRTQGANVYLDLTAKKEDFLRKRFARIYETCLQHGLDLASDLAPVCPAAHYVVGGVKTDEWGRTSLPGLYAAGETANTGVHGANRLAGNSLLEGLVFGARAGQAMRKDSPAGKRSGAALSGSSARKPGDPTTARATKRAAKRAPPATMTKIRDLMWRQAGILRSGKELAEAIKELRTIELPKPEKPERADHELRNLHSLAVLIASSALAREESRGSHYRSDFPYRDDEDFGKHSVIQKGKDIRFEA